SSSTRTGRVAERHCLVRSEPAPALGIRPQYPRRRQGHHATEHLTAQDGRIQVPGWLPRDLTVADHEHPSGARVHGETTHTTGYSSFAAGTVSARARGGIAVTAFPGAVARSISSIAATGAPGALATSSPRAVATSSPRAVATQRAGPVPTPGTRTGTADNTCHRDHAAPGVWGSLRGQRRHDDH